MLSKAIIELKDSLLVNAKIQALAAPSPGELSTGTVQATVTRVKLA